MRMEVWGWHPGVEGGLAGMWPSALGLRVGGLGAQLCFQVAGAPLVRALQIGPASWQGGGIREGGRGAGGGGHEKG